jgi:hypothetical protein
LSPLGERETNEAGGTAEQGWPSGAVTTRQEWEHASVEGKPRCLRLRLAEGLSAGSARRIHLLLVLATFCVVLSGGCQASVLRLHGLDAALGWMLLTVANVVLLSLLLAAASTYTATAVALGSAIVAALSVGAKLATRGRWVPRRVPSIRLHHPRTPEEWVAGILCLLVLVHLLVRAVLSIRLVPYGFDALSYHLAAVGWLVQDGRLPDAADGILLAGYPLSGELLAAWPAILLHDDVFSRLPQILTALLGGVATLGLARGIGASRPASVIAGCLFVLTPAVLAQVSTAYVDVTAAAFTVATYCFVIRWVGTAVGFKQRLFLGGLAGGLAMGTKTTGALVVAAACIAILVVAARRPPDAAVPSAVLFMITAAAAGGFWYVRNLLVYGNPIYPIGIAGLPGAATAASLLTPAPGPSLPEPIPTLWSWAHDLVPQHSYTYEQRVGGLGTTFVWIGLPCLLAVAVRAVRQKDPRLLTLLWVSAFIFALQPYRWWARFTLPLGAVAATAIAAMMSLPSLRAPRTRSVWRPRLLAAAIVASVLVTQPALFLRTVMPTDGGRPVAAWQAFTVAPGDRLAGSAGQPSALSAIASARTVAVAVDEVGRVGSLFGAQFQRRVRPVAILSSSAFTSSLVGADFLVACRGSTVDLWSALDPVHLHLIGDPRAQLLVWRVSGRPSVPTEAVPRSRTDDTYCT